MVVNAIYPAFHGEHNPSGIGAPVIIVRLQGCPIRCYKATLGVLCDTPEALEKPKGAFNQIGVNDILNMATSMGSQYGIYRILLTGGDPLWNRPESLETLFEGFERRNFEVHVETSGIIDPAPYERFGAVRIILDYKLLSAGISAPNILDKLPVEEWSRNIDVVKFVIYDNKDFEQMVAVLENLAEKMSYASAGSNRWKREIAVGMYYGSDMTLMELMNKVLLAKKAVIERAVDRPRRSSREKSKLRTLCAMYQSMRITAQLHNLAQIPGKVLLENLDRNLRQI